MLASKFRFHGYGALRFLFGHGRTYRYKIASIRVASNPRRTHSRVAVVVSKKVIKASPKRNRIRRRVYEILREHWDHIKPSQDIIITIHDPGAWDMPAQTLNSDLINAIKEAGLWTN